MFKFLKDKLKNAVSSIKKTVTKEKEEQVEKEIEEVKEQVKTGEIEEEKKESIIQKIKKKFTTVSLSEVEFEKVFWDLQRALLENNVAILTIEKIREDLKEKLVGKEIEKKKLDEVIKDTLKKTLEGILQDPFDFLKEIKKGSDPFVIGFFGINGSGKTTTISKVAYLLKKNNIPCVIAAADTFRAASIEQIQEHATKLEIDLIKHKYGSDPAAVAFDAIAHAKSKKIKVVLIDTAGRMHSNINLMEEMKKICRVAKPNLKIFVAESIIGNDAVSQAKEFDEKIDLDAIILTKSDVDEKGGAAISMSNVTKKPILFLGMGQEYKDLKEFSKKDIIKNIGL